MDWASVITAMTSQVALRKESVDRNLTCMKEVLPWAVALRKESVDRNVLRSAYYSPSPVALRKESVDRNKISCARSASKLASLSARRAWIEIRSLEGHRKP